MTFQKTPAQALNKNIDDDDEKTKRSGKAVLEICRRQCVKRFHRFRGKTRNSV